MKKIRRVIITTELLTMSYNNYDEYKKDKASKESQGWTLLNNYLNGYSLMFKSVEDCQKIKFKYKKLTDTREV